MVPNPRHTRLSLRAHCSSIRRIPRHWGVAPFLFAIRDSCAWIGVFLLSIDLPVWSQSTLQQAGQGASAVLNAVEQLPSALPGAGTAPTAAPAAPAAAAAGAGARLMDSYELCKIGRLGQHELSFLTVFILIGCFIFFLQIDRRLIQHGWDIRKALSESDAISYLAGDQSSGPVLNEKGEPLTVRTLVPSVSRLIALAGLIMLILFYFGFGIISIYHFGRTCEMPRGMNGVTAFLWAGLTFFAPYIATKFSEVFAPGARRIPPPSVRSEEN
jgi:hypothetical protein